MQWRNKLPLPGIPAETLQVKDSRGRVVLARTRLPYARHNWGGRSEQRS